MLTHALLSLASSLCTWNITDVEDKIILIHFTKLDVEYQVGCDHDYASLYSNRKELISKSGCLGGVRVKYNFLSFIVMRNSISSWLLRGLR